MIAIIISACMAGDPNVCKDFKIAVDGQDPAYCAAWAPPYFGQWAADNPGWTIKKWKCTAASADGI